MKLSAAKLKALAAYEALMDEKTVLLSRLAEARARRDAGDRDAKAIQEVLHEKKDAVSKAWKEFKGVP